MLFRSLRQRQTDLSALAKRRIRTLQLNALLAHRRWKQLPFGAFCECVKHHRALAILLSAVVLVVAFDFALGASVATDTERSAPVLTYSIDQDFKHGGSNPDTNFPKLLHETGIDHGTDVLSVPKGTPNGSNLSAESQLDLVPLPNRKPARPNLNPAKKMSTNNSVVPRRKSKAAKQQQSRSARDG